MDRTTRLKVLILVAIGFAAGILYTISCNMGPGDANAQDGVACEQWEYSIYHIDDLGCPIRPYLHNGDSCTIEAGWEPFFVGDFTTGVLGVRRCVSP